MAHHNFLSSVSGFLGDVSRARKAASIYDGLARLSDSELNQRGLSRVELSSYAFKTAFGDR